MRFLHWLHRTLMTGGSLFRVALIAALMLPATAHACEDYSKARTRTITRAAAKHYRLSAADTAWLEDAVIDIVYIGAAESHGDTHCRYGVHRGIVQFNGSWHANAYEKRLARMDGHTADWRMSGRASIARLVRCYRDGGKSAIRRHWAATLGR